MRYCIDLHNHSCLSPCASDDMIPAVLAVEAYDKEIDMVALTDHNTTGNLKAFGEACDIVGIIPIYGIEITTVEEIHLLALFEKLKEALEFGSWIESLLPKKTTDARLFGNQLLCDVEGNCRANQELFLIGSVNLSFDDLVENIVSMGALAIPAHIDRHANSVFANLGFLPPLPYSALESIAYPPVVNTGSYSVIQGSDAHYIEHIGRRRCFIESEKSGFAALKEAFELNKVSFLGK
jgi:PHP family Zn ribbon phosphoesterase